MKVLNYMDLGFQHPPTTTMKTSCLVYAYSCNVWLSFLVFAYSSNVQITNWCLVLLTGIDRHRWICNSKFGD